MNKSHRITECFSSEGTSGGLAKCPCLEQAAQIAQDSVQLGLNVSETGNSITGKAVSVLDRPHSTKFFSYVWTEMLIFVLSWQMHHQILKHICGYSWTCSSTSISWGCPGHSVPRVSHRCWAAGEHCLPRPASALLLTQPRRLLAVAALWSSCCPPGPIGHVLQSPAASVSGLVHSPAAVLHLPSEFPRIS